MSHNTPISFSLYTILEVSGIIFFPTKSIFCNYRKNFSKPLLYESFSNVDIIFRYYYIWIQFLFQGAESCVYKNHSNTIALVGQWYQLKHLSLEVLQEFKNRYIFLFFSLAFQRYHIIFYRRKDMFLFIFAHPSRELW